MSVIAELVIAVLVKVMLHYLGLEQPPRLIVVLLLCVVLEVVLHYVERDSGDEDNDRTKLLIGAVFITGLTGLLLITSSSTSTKATTTTAS